MIHVIAALKKSIASVFHPTELQPVSVRLNQSLKSSTAWPSADASRQMRAPGIQSAPPRTLLWRGSVCQQSAPIPLQLAAKRGSQFIYWRGVKRAVPVYERAPDASVPSAQHGFWRGARCEFNTGCRATLV